MTVIDNAPATTTAAGQEKVDGQGVVKPADLVRALTAVMPHAGTDDTLPMLTALEFTSDGDGTLTIAATNRYTLGTYVLDWDGGKVNSLIRLRDAKELHRFAKASAKTLANLVSLRLTFDNVELVANDFDRRASYPTMVETFVRWRSIMPPANPETEGVERIALNPVFLASFAKAAQRGEPMRLFFGASRLKPVRVEVGDSFVGLIMPVRNPEWDNAGK